MTSAALTPGYAGHPDADFLAQLAAELNRIGPVVVAFGAQADAENSTATRVFFIDEEWQAKPRKLQPAGNGHNPYAGSIGGNASADGNRKYMVTVYAGDMGALYRLWAAVCDKLDYLASWTATDVGAASKPGPLGTGAGAAGFGLTMPVTVKGPIYREVYGQGFAATVTQQTIVSADAAGTNADALPPP